MTGIAVGLATFLCVCAGVFYGVMAFAAAHGLYGLILPFLGMCFAFLLAGYLIWNCRAEGALVGMGAALVQLVPVYFAAERLTLNIMNGLLMGLTGLLLWVWWMLRRRP